MFPHLFCTYKQVVLAVRVRLLEEQFQSEIAQLKNANAELKAQLVKANERNDWLEGKAKAVVEEENFEKSWLMPTNCSFASAMHTNLFTGSLL